MFLNQSLILKSAFFLLFLVVGVITALHLSVVITVMNATAEQISRYPFGTEMGFNYCSKETYQAVSAIFFYIGVATLLTATCFYRFGYRIIAVINLLVPAALYFTV